MKVSSFLFRNGKIVNYKNQNLIEPSSCNLVIGFASKSLLETESSFQLLRQKFPNASIALSSTAGEIFENGVFDDSLSVICFQFKNTKIQTACVNISSFADSFAAGASLINKIDSEELKYVFVLSDGALVNGSELVRGIESVINHVVPVTGGLAGDGINFQSTLVGLNEVAKAGNILAVGFYGNSIKIGHSSMGGWEMFGLEKKVTKSKGNELFEIDNVCALEIYKKYLGSYANDLPSSALLFPLSITINNEDDPIVRTILSIDHEKKSMLFAGDVPEGSKVRFMKANFDKLIEASSDAAQNSLFNFKNTSPKAAILISCVGRKIILSTRIDEEVEAVRNVLGEEIILTGFYSYGEISPLRQGTKCALHNQTMTITIFYEN